MYIHSAGYRVILVFFVLLVLLAVLVHFIPGMPSWLEWSLRGIFLLVFCQFLWFFRIPPRPFDAAPDEVTAVSDWKVGMVEEVQINLTAQGRASQQLRRPR